MRTCRRGGTATVACKADGNEFARTLFLKRLGNENDTMTHAIVKCIRLAYIPQSHSETKKKQHLFCS
jgi:hypothetical protein